MTSAHCAACGEAVTIPSEAGREALVRCPWCQAEYRLEAVLAGLPPLLIVVAPVPLEAAGAAADAFPAAEAGASAVLPMEAVVTRPVAAVRPLTRSRQRRSPLGELMKIVAGGVVGLAMGQAILWWGVGRDPFRLGPEVSDYASWAVPATFRRQPASGALSETGPGGYSTEPRVSRVPQDLSRGAEEPWERLLPRPGWPEATGSADTPRVDPIELRPGGPEPAAREEHASSVTSPAEPARADEVMAERSLPAQPPEAAPRSVPATHPPSGELLLEVRPEPAAPVAETPPVPAETSLAPDPATTIPAAAMPTPAEPAAAQLPAPAADLPGDALESGASLEQPRPSGTEPAVPAAEPTLPASVDVNEAVEPALVRGLPPRTTADLARCLAEVRRAAAAWDADGAVAVEEFRRRARELYQALAGLGEVLAAVDHADPQVGPYRDEMLVLLLEICRDAKKAELIRKAAPAWLSARRPHDGVTLLGTVVSVEHREELFETHLRIQPDQVVSVVSARDPRQAFQPGTPVLLLGLIVLAPADNIAGYGGSATFAVLDGFHAVVPDAETR